MKRALGWMVLAVVAVLGADTVASANAAPFGRPEKLELTTESVPLTYREEATTTVSRVRIPVAFLEKAAQPKPDDAGEEADKGAHAADHWRTLIAAVAMSLAAVSVVFMRNRSRAVKVAMLVAAVGIASFAVAQASSAEAPNAPANRSPHAAAA